MERLINTLLFGGLLAAVSLPAHAGPYTRIVHDKKTTAAVAANTAYEEAVEEVHNHYLTRQQEKKQKLAKMAVAMETFKEAYRISMQNTRGFGYETSYYRQIAKECAEFPVNFTKASKVLLSSPFFNYAASIEQLTNIQLDMVQLVDKFVNIINNGKIDNPLKKNASNIAKTVPEGFGKDGDGYNFMDRNQRLNMACTILAKIQDINDRLYMITIICKYYSGLGAFVRSIDPVTWRNFFTSRTIVESSISDWNWHVRHKI